MELKNLRLNLSNVNTSTNKRDMEVVETSVNRVRLEDGSWSRDIASYSLHCCVNHGDILKVKVSKELASKVTALNDALGDDVTVTVTFSGLKLKAFAMRGNGSDGIISGVSAVAENFEYEVKSVDEDFQIEI